MKKLMFLGLLFGLVFFSINSSQAQLCNACFSISPDTNNTNNINLDATCSNASPAAIYDWYVDGVLYVSFPSPYLQVPFYMPGQHDIQLIINDLGCIDSITQVISITANCNANFFSYNLGGGLYYFYSSGTGTPTTTYAWDYGDGGTSNLSIATHTYLVSGTYTVCCIISDTAFGGCSDTSCQVVNVNTNYNCHAEYYYNLDPFTGSLFADANFFSTYNPANYSMNWYLNGVLMQQGPSTSYNITLSSIGLYDLKLILSDSNMVSCDSMSQSFYWSGGGVLNPSCYPCFSTLYNASYDSIYFDAACSNIPIGGSLQWNINGNIFPDPGVGFMQGFTTVGTQYVSLYTLDSNNVACDSIFQYVYTVAPPCTSCLTVTQTLGSSSDYLFDGTCTPGASNYSWFVDNAFVVTTNSPQFNYSFSQSGTYTICLQTSDLLGTFCNQSCTTIVVNTPLSTSYDLSGVIYQVDNFFNYSPAANGDAKVYLIKLITGGSLDAIDSTITDANGRYTFSNKPIDDYRIKVALNPGSANYAMNIPTYFNTAYMWYDAQVVTLFGNSYNKDIYMNYGNNTGGSGFISGNVFLGANKSKRSGNADVTLILIDQTTQLPAAYAKPDMNGDYTFSNVPYGTYKIYGELLNRASIPESITLSASQSSFTNKNFMYNDNVVKPTNMSLSVGEIEESNTLTIAPNPAQQSFYISNSGKKRSLIITDITGRIIQQFDVMPSTKMNIDCSGWNKGVYLVKDTIEGKSRTIKLIVD